MVTNQWHKKQIIRILFSLGSGLDIGLGEQRSPSWKFGTGMGTLPFWTSQKLLNHGILFDYLQAVGTGSIWFGVVPLLHLWMVSVGRRGQLGGSFIDGAPQGSVLASFLFNICVKTVEGVIQQADMVSSVSDYTHLCCNPSLWGDVVHAGFVAG